MEEKILRLLELACMVGVALAFDWIDKNEAGLHFADITRQIIALKEVP